MIFCDVQANEEEKVFLQLPWRNGVSSYGHARSVSLRPNISKLSETPVTPTASVRPSRLYGLESCPLTSMWLQCNFSSVRMPSPNSNCVTKATANSQKRPLGPERLLFVQATATNKQVVMSFAVIWAHTGEGTPITDADTIIQPHPHSIGRRGVVKPRADCFALGARVA